LTSHRRCLSLPADEKLAIPGRIGRIAGLADIVAIGGNVTVHPNRQCTVTNLIVEIDVNIDLIVSTVAGLFGGVFYSTVAWLALKRKALQDDTSAITARAAKAKKTNVLLMLVGISAYAIGVVIEGYLLVKMGAGLTFVGVVWYVIDAQRAKQARSI
jgi:hypothetical protein